MTSLRDARNLALKDAAERFKRDTEHHEMTVLHDEGMYRHLRFKGAARGIYWFDLVTWPGTLAVRGDIRQGYMFSRLPDMFEFFRGNRINPDYWAEKTEGGVDSAMCYSVTMFRQSITEQFSEAVACGDAPDGLLEAVGEQILGSSDIHDEVSARQLVEAFEYEGFRFDVWDLDCRDFDWSFLWACHAIVWGIGQYDALKAQSLAAVDA